MKKDSFAKLVICLTLCLNAPVGYSQSEDFALFIKRFSADTAFQKERVVFPIPQISWDYENDKEKTTPIGKEKYQIPFGQYALHIISNVPVCACFGRLDVRQTNMAYYSLAGYSF